MMSDAEFEQVRLVASKKATVEWLVKRNIQPYIWINDVKEPIDCVDGDIVSISGKRAPVPEFSTPIGTSSKVSGYLSTGEKYTFRRFELYQQEFNGWFDLGFDHYLYPFLSDSSWRNDTSPSFAILNGNIQCVLWVENATPALRGLEGSLRYTVESFPNPDDRTVAETLLNTDDSDELVRFLATIGN